METSFRQVPQCGVSVVQKVPGGEQVEKLKGQKVMWVVEHGLLQLHTGYHMDSSPGSQASGGRGGGQGIHDILFLTASPTVPSIVPDRALKDCLLIRLHKS